MSGIFISLCLSVTIGWSLIAVHLLQRRCSNVANLPLPNWEADRYWWLASIYSVSSQWPTRLRVGLGG